MTTDDADLGGAEPAEPIPVMAVARFCNRCGAEWQAGWAACDSCAGRAAAAARPPTVATVVGIRSSVALDFTLLAVIVGGTLSIVAGAPQVTVEVAMLAVEAVVVVAWCVGERREVAPALAPPTNPAWFPAALGLALCTYAVASAAVNGLHRLVGLPMLEYSPPFLTAGYGWEFVVLNVAIGPAVLEELAFRGVILSSLRRVLTDGEAMAVSALMFMVLHLSVPSFPHLLLLGLILAFLRLRSGSLLPGMLLHFTHNLLCVLGERWPGIDPFR